MRLIRAGEKPRPCSIVCPSGRGSCRLRHHGIFRVALIESLLVGAEALAKNYCSVASSQRRDNRLGPWFTSPPQTGIRGSLLCITRRAEPKLVT